MGGEKKPLVMSDLGCADGCGRKREEANLGAENCADGCGRRGCKGVAGNGWGEEAAGDERPWLHGRLRTGKWVRRTAWTAADGVGATEWLEMGGEKKPLVMSDLGCADGCGWQMGAENCADGCGRRGCKGVAGNVGEKKPLGMSDLAARTAADGKWVRRTARTAGEEAVVMSDLTARTAADGKWVRRTAVRGVGATEEEAAGDERPWLRGRLRTANGCGELRGPLRTAWVQGGGWKWVGRRSRW